MLTRTRRMSRQVFRFPDFELLLPYKHRGRRLIFTCPNCSYSHTAPHWNTKLDHALQDMSIRGLDVKFKDYHDLLSECIKHKSLREGQRVQAHMIKTRYLPTQFLRNRLIDLYLKCEALDGARMVFIEMPDRNVVSWTTIISGYARSGGYSEAISLFIQMLRSGTEPNEHTFATILPSCVGDFGFECGRQIHALIAKSSFELHIYVGSSLLDLYAKVGRIDEARIIFEDLPQKDTVCCTAIISGYAQLGLDREALELFCTLHREGLASNYVTYATTLTAMSGMAAYEYGKQVHGHALRAIQSHVVLQNSLIDLYSKCGNLSYARRIFDTMPGRTVVSWNTLLAGYSKNGIGKAAIELYNMMREDNRISPDSTTLLTVLSGCSHGGMEKVGLQLFDEMRADYELDLGIEHYGCVVDLLGRAGQLERALQFIKEMPLEPNAAIWSSLLGACTVHRNIAVGKVAGDRLLEMEPEIAGNYVIVCNLYKSHGRCEEVKQVRGLMKEKAVIKKPGKSWV